MLYPHNRVFTEYYLTTKYYLKTTTKETTKSHKLNYNGSQGHHADKKKTISKGHILIPFIQFSWNYRIRHGDRGVAKSVEDYKLNEWDYMGISMRETFITVMVIE